MFLFPPQTTFGKPVPKARIYAHASPRRRVQDLFTSQVAEIRWAHKLSPETIHLSATAAVPEIEIFDILLKQTELDDQVLDTIDRAIPYPILYRVKSQHGQSFSAAYKRPGEQDASKWGVGTRYTAEIPNGDSPGKPLPAVLHLGHLYAALFAPLLPLPSREGELLGDQIARCDRVQVLRRKIDQLTSRIQREKQFNRKVALNQELKPLQEELKILS